VLDPADQNSEDRDSKDVRQSRRPRIRWSVP
jgi:hypothetical protein